MTLRPEYLAIISMALFAYQNKVLKDLSQYSLVVIFFGFHIPIFLLGLVALFFMKIYQMPFVMPPPAAYRIFLVGGLMLFAGEMLYMGAYALGGGLVSMTTISMLIPVFVSLLVWFESGGMPNAYQLGGYLFGCISIILIMLGSRE